MKNVLIVAAVALAFTGPAFAGKKNKPMVSPQDGIAELLRSYGYDCTRSEVWKTNDGRLYATCKGRGYYIGMVGGELKVTEEKKCYCFGCKPPHLKA